MDIKCSNCQAPLLKSYGTTIKLRSKSIRWDSEHDTAVVQCNMCRSFSDVPLAIKIAENGVVLELGKEIKKSVKEQLIVKADFKSETKPKGKKPTKDYRGKKDNGDGTVTYT